MSEQQPQRPAEDGQEAGQQNDRQNGQQNGAMKQTERVQMSGGPGHGPGGMVGQKAMTFGPSAKRLIRRLAPERASVIAVLVLAVLSVTLMALGPRLLGKATDLVFAGFVGGNMPEGITKSEAIAGAEAEGSDQVDLLRSLDFVPGQGVDFTRLGWVLLGVLAIYVAASLISWLQGFLLNGVVQNTVRRMRSDVEDKINALPLEYFDKQPRGELLSRATNDIDNVSQTLQQTLSQLLTSLLTVLAVLAMMFWISPVLALIALVSVPVSMILTAAIMRRSQTQFIAQWRRTGQLNAHIEESFSGHALVRVFGRSREVERTFAEENDGLYDASFRAQFISGLIMPMMMFIGNLNYVVIAVVGAVKVTNGSLTIGEVQAFIQYTRQFTQPLTTVASMMNLLQSGVASAERVFELLDAPEQSPDPEPGERLPAPVRGDVRFDDVTFRYVPDEPLIEDLSLEAPPGRTVAIVGPTGAGKTTLVNLLMRFYELDGGRISVDGVDVAQVPRADVRGAMGMVLQDAWLFEGTIRENIAYGRPDADEDEIVAAATATFVDRFAHSLPDGYDTVITDDGGSVSAGERQLITIARAFLADPSILILDEATSAVDTRTELLLQQAMTALRSDRTSFVIAHRLSTIRDADLIVVMEQGHIVEQGTHESLLERDGAYARLYRSQFAAPLT